MLVAERDSGVGERAAWEKEEISCMLTQPSDGVYNNAWDNIHGHYILRRNDRIYDGCGKRYGCGNY